MSDALKCEARLTSLRARRQRWLSRLAEVADKYGAGDQRGQCKHNIKVVDELIAVAEKKLRTAQVKAAPYAGETGKKNVNPDGIDLVQSATDVS